MTQRPGHCVAAPCRRVDTCTCSTLCMQAPAAESGTVMLSLPALKLSATQPVTFTAAGVSQSTLRLNVSESTVTRWWPLNYGPQQLYDVWVDYTPTSPSITCRGSGVTDTTSSVTSDSVAANKAQQEVDVAACIRAAQSVVTRRIGFR